MSRITEILHIRPSEERRTALLFLQLFAASGIFILGRTTRDTLFLSRYPIDVLPWMFVAYGIVSSLVVVLYGRFADRVARPTLLHATSIAGIATYASTWILVRAEAAWIYPAFYIWAEVVANLFIVQFWTMAAEFDHPRDARRLNATIGAARPLGIIFFGLVTGGLVSWIGTEQLLFVLTLLMALVAGSVYLLRNEPRIDHSPPARSAGGALETSLAANSYFRSLAGLILVMFIALTLGDYQFKVIARDYYREDDLARFFSFFYGIVGILSFLFQLFATPRILSRLGVGSALTVLPGVFGTSSLAILVWPGLGAASCMKFADNGLQFTLHDTTMQSLYAPFPARMRARIRGVLEGSVKPLSYGAGGLILALLGAFEIGVERISILTVGLALCWQGLIPIVRRHYLRSLERGIAGPRAAQLFEEPFVLGIAERKLLIHALSSPDATRVWVALDQLSGEISEEFRAELRALLTRPEAVLRARAVEGLVALEDRASLDAFRRAAHDPDPVVRAAAVAALARFVSEEVPGEVYPFADDPAAEVRSEALAGLIRHGGIEGATRAGEKVLRLIDSADAKERREACAILARLGSASYLPLSRLLEDTSPRVRRAAMRAAGGIRDRRLVPLMVSALSDPSLCGAAMTALIAVGDPALPSIDRCLRNPELPRKVRLELPRVLSRIQSEASISVLKNFSEDPDSRMRLRVYAAIGRLRHQMGYTPESADRLLPKIRREVTEARGNVLAWKDAKAVFGTPLLLEEMDLRLRRAERRIVRLLQHAFDWRKIDLILTALRDPGRRPQALEALDATLSPALRQIVIPFLENPANGSSGEFLRDPSVCILPPAEFVRLQVHHPNPYVSLLALDALARAKDKGAVPIARQVTRHRDPLVREGAIRALAMLEPASLPSDIGEFLEDPDRSLRNCARYLAGRLEEATELRSTIWENTMYGTIERILFLKGTPLFSGLSGEDLAPLARVTDVVSFSPGELVFEEGSGGDHFYIVISGKVVLESRGRELRRAGPGQTLGELSVLDRTTRSDTARAIESTDLLRIGAEEFFEVLHEQSEIAESMIRILAAQLREARAYLLAQAEFLDPRTAPRIGPPPAM